MATTTANPSVATDQAYDKLCAKLKEISALEGISGLLGWDEMVLLPEGAAGCRGAQKEALAGVLFDKRTDAELGTLLRELGDASSLDAVQKAVVRDAARDYRKSTAVPKDLVQRIAKLDTDAYVAWVQARQKSDFSVFAPYLQQWVDVSREKAGHLGPGQPAYDVLLDDYERGMTSARLDQVFAEVRDGLVPLLAAINERGTTPDDSWLTGEYDVDTQAQLCKQVALDLGFDLTCGRLDVSVHPFTGGSHPTDVRMTTRFKKDNFMEGLTGAVHETGHALYEQGRNLEYDGLPVNSPLSMGVHESQSLLWERCVGLSRAFAAYLQPRLAASFPEVAGRTAEELYAAANTVQKPSLIRVESDEATYPLHVILRYELEKGLLDGSVAVADVPRLWNGKMAAYLDCTPANDAQGCLQDVHWSKGLFGYFPTYSLGAMYAVQIFRHAATQLPGLETQLAAGNFSALKAWLNKNIHAVGSLHASGDELMEAVTGSPLDPQVFLDYLRLKYTELYKL